MRTSTTTSFETWFTPEQIERMYERNPVWAEPRRAALRRSRTGPRSARGTGPAGHEAEGSLRPAQPSGPATRAARRRTRSSCTEAMRSSTEIEPMLVARIGPSGDIDPPRAPGRAVQRRRRRPEPVLRVHRDRTAYDFFYETYRDKRLYTIYFADFLRTLQARRRALPAHALHRLRPRHARRAGCCRDVPIVYTLHEYLPICHRDGQMVRTSDRGALPRTRLRAAATSASRTGRRSTSSCASA